MLRSNYTFSCNNTYTQEQLSQAQYQCKYHPRSKECKQYKVCYAKNFLIPRLQALKDNLEHRHF
jgi:hypothetical protein